MRKLLFYFTIILSLCACAGPVKEDLEQTRLRIEELKKMVDQTNATLSSVQRLVSSLQGSNYISEVTPINERDRQTGYSVSFWNGNKIEVTLGVDGIDGYSPSFSVREDSDGHYYWTLDGEWLNNPYGEKLRADGIEPEDVVIPKLKVEDGYWKISTDGGNGWTNLAPENEAFYFRVISEVDQSSKDKVTFVLSDGTRLDIPRFVPISLSLGSVLEDRVIAPGEVLTIPYRVDGSITDDLVITSGTDGTYTSEVIQRDAREGSVRVTCPGEYRDGYVFIMVHDSGYSSVKMINFQQRKMEIGDGFSYKIGSEGGIVTTSFKANFDFTTETLDGSESWLHVSRSTTADNEGSLNIIADPNNTASVRSGVINIRPADNPDHIWASVSVTQASPFFSMDVSRVQAGSDGGEFNVEITSYRGVSLKNPTEAEWLSAAFEDNGDFHNLKITIAKNHSDSERTATLGIYTSDGKELQGEVTITQQSWDLDHYKDMVFQVRANMANEWEAYLPIRGEMNCYVDWGDGNIEIIDKTLPIETWDEKNIEWIHHEYETRVPTSYRVSVAGSVEALNSMNMPRKGAITAIQQWGDVGLKSMAHAFEGYPRLFSLPGDPIGAFREVTDFEGAFRNCIYLTEIDNDLLANAVKAKSLYHLFESCKKLRIIPDGLLRNCAEARNFDSMFSDCTSLEEIPENLFWCCPKAETFASTFNSTRISNIPEMLFAKCPEVISFSAVFCLSPVNDPPEKLFANNTKVREFNRAFYYCQNIHSIPERLFANNPDVTTFEGTFGQDYGLRMVPAGLFDSNRKVLDFGATFWDIRFEESIESPYTVINGKKVHLYERIKYADHFITPTSTASCFSDGWKDSNSIPIEWK